MDKCLTTVLVLMCSFLFASELRVSPLLFLKICLTQCSLTDLKGKLFDIRKVWRYQKGNQKYWRTDKVKKDTRTNKDPQNTTQKIKHRATRTTQKTRGGLRYPGKLAVPAPHVAHVVLLVYYFELTKKCTRCLWEVILRLGNPCRCIDWHERVVCLVL